MLKHIEMLFMREKRTVLVPGKADRLYLTHCHCLSVLINHVWCFVLLARNVLCCVRWVLSVFSWQFPQG